MEVAIVVAVVVVGVVVLAVVVVVVGVVVATVVVVVVGVVVVVVVVFLAVVLVLETASVIVHGILGTHTPSFLSAFSNPPFLIKSCNSWESPLILTPII